MGIEESIGAGLKTPMGAALDAGMDTVSYDQVVRFTLYRKLVLPADGFVFWVRADLVNLSALLLPPQSLLLGAQTLQDVTFDAKGSLHYVTAQQQNADESFDLNRVSFNAQEEVEEFNLADSQTVWIGEIDDIQFAFSGRASFYQQAGIWHYQGDAIYPSMRTQIINDPADLNLRDVVVSNSLPVWLTLNSVAPVYPAFLVPDNLEPPWISIDVQETRGLASVPMLDENLSHYQLSSDKVRVTTYGLRNDQIMDYFDSVIRYMSDDSAAMGLMNDIPVVIDDKRQQNELNILAQKKRIDFQVSYVQARVRDVGRQFILSAVPLIIPRPLAP